MNEPSFHLTPDEFRRHGTEVVEWIARYLETVEEPARALAPRSRGGPGRAAGASAASTPSPGPRSSPTWTA